MVRRLHRNAMALNLKTVFQRVPAKSRVRRLPFHLPSSLK